MSCTYLRTGYDVVYYWINTTGILYVVPYKVPTELWVLHIVQRRQTGYRAFNGELLADVFSAF